MHLKLESFHHHCIFYVVLKVPYFTFQVILIPEKRGCYRPEGVRGVKGGKAAGSLSAECGEEADCKGIIEVIAYEFLLVCFRWLCLGSSNVFGSEFGLIFRSIFPYRRTGSEEGEGREGNNWDNDLTRSFLQLDHSFGYECSDNVMDGVDMVDEVLGVRFAGEEVDFRFGEESGSDDLDFEAGECH